MTMEIKGLGVTILGYAREETSGKPVAVVELTDPVFGNKVRQFAPEEEILQALTDMEEAAALAEKNSRPVIINGVDFTKELPDIRHKLNTVLETLQNPDLHVNSLLHPDEFASEEVDPVPGLEPLPPPPDEPAPITVSPIKPGGM